MLTIRLIGLDDYIVRENGQTLGRIRLSHDRSPPIWLWNVTVTIGAPFGEAATLDEAKGRFKVAWEGLKDKQSPQKLAQVWANRPDRNRQ